MKKQAVIYTRVSTDSKTQSQSLENQRSHYEDWCKRNGYEMLHVYPEKGLSGTNARRPEFIQLMHDAGLNHTKNENGYDHFEESTREPKFNYIICKDVSRFSRSSHIGMLTIEYLRNKKVYVNFENSGLVTDAPDWHLRASILFTIAQNESENTSQRVKFTKRNNAKNGIYRPSRLPFGYMRNAEGEYIINEEEAEIVNFIHDNYPENGSHILSKNLNSKKTPTQLGKKWTGDKITRIIKNRTYTGTAEVGRSEKNNVTDTKRINVPEDEWILIENAVPPIITFEQYEANSKIRESRINKNTKLGRRVAKNDIYHERLYCANCGSRFIRHIGAKDKITYMCQWKRKGLDCNVRGISIQLVTGFFDRVDISSLSNAMGNYGYYNLLMKNLALAAKSLTQRVDELTSQIEALEADNKQTLEGIKKQFKGGSQDVIDMLTKDIEDNKVKIGELIALKEKINIQAIHDIRDQTENKKLLIEDIQESKGISKEEKLKLLKSITISDYDVKLEFHFPSFEEEVANFNAIFTTSQIEMNMGFEPFSETHRREHLEAREYWSEIDFTRRDNEEFFRNNPTED